MKKMTLVLLSCAMLTACNNGQKINGHNEKTVYRSVQMIKPRLPENTRLEYEIAFGLLREAEKDNAIFFKSIDGKTPSELIAMGKDIFGYSRRPERQYFSGFSRRSERYKRRAGPRRHGNYSP